MEKKIICRKIGKQIAMLSHLYFTSTFSHLKDTGIHPGQLPVLMSLAKHDGMTQSSIADKAHTKRSTVCVMMQRMERAGLVRRQPDEHDRRMTRVCLTEKGRAITNQAKEMFELNETNLFEGVTREELLQTEAVFEKMIANLRKEQTYD